MSTFGTVTDTHAYLAIGEVADALNVTVATVRNWERAGRIYSVRTPGGHRRFLASQIEALLAREPWDAA